MARGIPAPKVDPTAEEREELERCARRQKTARIVALRAQALLLAADGWTSLAIAEKLDVSRPSVGKWRKRFVEKRMQALYDEPRPGAPRKFTDRKVEDVVRKTLETLPRNATQWSRTSMSEAAGISESTVGRIWRAFGLKPHRSDTYKLSTDPLFIEKVRDIVGLYLDPPARALVLSVDEKTQVQALNRTQPLLPMRPGQAERRTHDYERCGTTSLFAALDVKTGRVIGACHRRHRTKEFVKFLDAVDDAAPPDLDIHLILDNASTHKTPAVHRWLLRHPRYHLHFTPTSSSWINQVERFFALITEKQIRRGVHRSTQALETAIRTYLDAHNETPKPFSWTKSADEILDSIRRHCQRTSGGGH